MKKMLFLIFLFPLALVAGEGVNKRYFATINIHTKTNLSYEVYVDGYRYDLFGELFINRLRPGSHDIRVVEHCVNRRGYGYAKVIYQDRVFLPHGSELVACIDRFGDFRIDRIFRPRVNNYCQQACAVRHRHNFHPDYYRGSTCRRGSFRRSRGYDDWDD